MGSLGLLGFLGILYFTLPSFESLENPQFLLASTIYSDDGSVLGKYFLENRTPVKYEELSPYLEKALVATEDERYYEHAGIDKEAIARVVVLTVAGGSRESGGGSTITQQLAKMLVGRPKFEGWRKVYKMPMMVVTKLREWMTAVRLERCYTKEEIIAMYLNKFDFLHNSYGIQSASKIYFDKKPADLNIQEAALLVGMLKNPAYFNPVRFPERTKGRRNTVFAQMHRNGLFGSGAEAKAKLDSLQALPMDLTKFKREDHNEGLAPHFREHLRNHLKKVLKNTPKPNGEEWDLYADGLKIYTTIDYKMQRHAESSVREHLSKMQPIFMQHWKDMDPWTYDGSSETEVPVYARKEQLDRNCWETKRWEGMREAIMPLATELKLRDVDVQRMLTAEEKKNDVLEKGEKNYFEKLVKQGYLTPEKKSTYEQIMASSDWAKLKREREAMWAKFKKPIKMNVFTYTKEGEYSSKDTLMSPYDSIRYHKMFLQSGMVAVVPQTGHVKVWVGGTDHHFYKYDHVNKGTRRQVGSTIKPLLYATSFNFTGRSPLSTEYDGPVSICPGDGSFGLIGCWSPKNAGGGYSYGNITLITALKNSLNNISASLMKGLNSTKPFREFLSNAGIDTTLVPPQPSICLGSVDLSVLDMAGAYTVFPNLGVYSEPTYVTKVEDRYGNVIYEAAPVQRQALSESAAYAMCYMLQQVVHDAPGFGGMKSKVGGKTGTTNDQSDAWFMGVHPELVVATWTGCDDRFVRFRTMAGQGARMARPIFQKFLSYVEKDSTIQFNTDADFARPEDMKISLNPSDYFRADGGVNLNNSFYGNGEEGDDSEYGDAYDNVERKTAAPPKIETVTDEDGEDDYSDPKPKTPAPSKPAAAAGQKTPVPAPTTKKKPTQ